MVGIIILSIVVGYVIGVAKYTPLTFNPLKWNINQAIAAIVSTIVVFAVLTIIKTNGY